MSVVLAEPIGSDFNAKCLVESGRFMALSTVNMFGREERDSKVNSRQFEYGSVPVSASFSLLLFLCGSRVTLLSITSSGSISRSESPAFAFPSVVNPEFRADVVLYTWGENRNMLILAFCSLNGNTAFACCCHGWKKWLLSMNLPPLLSTKCMYFKHFDNYFSIFSS